MDIKRILDLLLGEKESIEETSLPCEGIDPLRGKERPKALPPPPQPPKIKTPEEDLQLENRSPFVKEILINFFIPFRDEFERQNATEGFLALLEFIDQEGDCPSFVRKSKEPEEKLLRELKFFETVSLKEHSLNVSREIVRLIKEEFRLDFNSFVPEAFILSLAHDLGKIPSVRDQNSYIKADHPYLSALQLEKIFSRVKAPFWIERAKEAIRGHHRPSPHDRIANLLRKADQKARELETLKYNQALKPKPQKGWPEPERILQQINPLIDKILLNNKFAAFSWGSIIFIQPDALYEAARRLAVEDKIVSWDLLQESEKRKVEIEIINSLRQKGMLAENIPEGDYGRICVVEYPHRTVSMKLVPVKIEAFGKLPSRIVTNFKHGYLATIKFVKIKPLGPLWRKFS